jgi:hypothetical protein
MITREFIERWERRIRESFMFHVLRSEVEGHVEPPKPCVLFRQMLEEAGLTVER